MEAKICKQCEYNRPDTRRREEYHANMCDECFDYEEKLEYKEELLYEAMTSTSNYAEHCLTQ